MSRKSKGSVVPRHDADDAPIDAAKEMVQELASRGKVRAAVDVLELMEKTQLQPVLNVDSKYSKADQE